MDKNQKVSLGCGTLILIALIVLFFANAGNEELVDGLHDLRFEVSQLRSAVEQLDSSLRAQSRQLQAIQQRMETWHPGQPSG